VAATSSETILLVEDDDAVLQVTARILRSYGFVVLTARNPETARNYCREKGDAIALLLTDVVMPEISGPKLADELSIINPKMRILYMSGYPGGKAASEEVLDSRHQILEKPFTPAKLVEKVRMTLDGVLSHGDSVES
jgi:DNA-binding NtrC family response regulator